MNNVIIKINTLQKKYDVILGKNILSNVDKYFNCKRKSLIITDKNIPIEYINKIKNKCYKPYLFIIKPGENSKSFFYVKKILKFLVKNNFSRDDCIIAIGGGVVGDLSAFISSIYMRGIDFLNIPTTLLSQVDSSIGGKTGIDFFFFLNVVGSFYQPSLVLIDISTLKTLSERQFNNGLVEIIKIAATLDKKLFDKIKLSKNIKNDIFDIIKQSIILKKIVVEKDTKEKNIRKVLNFGHTIGHAIEESCNRKYLHGECVGIGMLYFSSNEVKNEIKKLLIKYNLPISFDLNKKKIKNLISLDKKKFDNRIDTINVSKIGSYKIKKLTIDEIINLLE